MRPVALQKGMVARCMSNDESQLVSSRRNPRIVEARKLAQRKHRAQQGRFLVEGLQLLQMGLDAGARPREAFFCPEIGDEGPAREIVDRLRNAGADIISVTPHVMGALAERDEPQGLVASFDIFGVDLEEHLPIGELGDSGMRGLPEIPSDGLVLILDRLQDPGNLGTLSRTADAVGASAVVVITPSVDPFEPKAVRGSMGSIFAIPLIRAREAELIVSWLKGCGLRVVAADAHAGEDWGDTALTGGVALVVGNEARGLSDDLEPLIDARVRLPMAGGAESLNVAVAGGVLMYAWLRRRMPTLADGRG